MILTIDFLKVVLDGYNGFKHLTTKFHSDSQIDIIEATDDEIYLTITSVDGVVKDIVSHSFIYASKVLFETSLMLKLKSIDFDAIVFDEEVKIAQFSDYIKQDVIDLGGGLSSVKLKMILGFDSRCKYFETETIVNKAEGSVIQYSDNENRYYVDIFNYEFNDEELGMTVSEVISSFLKIITVDLRYIEKPTDLKKHSTDLTLKTLFSFWKIKNENARKKSNIL